VRVCPKAMRMEMEGSHGVEKIYEIKLIRHWEWLEGEVPESEE
jgi:hypothetical protein